MPKVLSSVEDKEAGELEAGNSHGSGPGQCGHLMYKQEEPRGNMYIRKSVVHPSFRKKERAGVQGPSNPGPVCRPRVVYRLPRRPPLFLRLYLSRDFSARFALSC